VTLKVICLPADNGYVTNMGQQANIAGPTKLYPNLSKKKERFYCGRVTII
jgi:hypothetical protein